MIVKNIAIVKSVAKMASTVNETENYDAVQQVYNH